MSWDGKLSTGSVEKALQAAKTAGEDELKVTMSDPSEDTPPVAVTITGGKVHASVDFGEAE
jgi:hypothetical protein